MNETIINNINSILHLAPPLLAEFIAALQPVSLSKGDYFLREGDYCRRIALVTKGAFYALLPTTRHLSTITQQGKISNAWKMQPC